MPSDGLSVILIKYRNNRLNLGVIKYMQYCAVVQEYSQISVISWTEILYNAIERA